MNSLKCVFLVSAALLVSAAAANDDADHKKEKSFSIFNVVNFQNTQCRSQDTVTSGTVSNRNGTCYTASECSSKGGVASGNCASGFGVCCLFKVSAVSSTIKENNTYIQNPSFPAVYSGTATTLSYKIQKTASNICWLRLDFETFTLVGPTATDETNAGGACVDTFKITNPTKQIIPTICGKNTGQHMYIDFGTDVSETVSLDFSFSGASTVRTWEIKTTQIECSNPSRPPAGCLQYHTTLIGRITTFNFLDTATMHLAGQDYSICVRKQEGYCCTQYQVCPDQANAFSLGNTDVTQLADQLCTSDYIAIPGSGPLCSTGNVQLGNRYCGAYLGLSASDVLSQPVCDCSAPFIVNVHTDILAEAQSGAIKNRGTCLDYTQIACSGN